MSQCAVLLPLYDGDRPDWFEAALDSILTQQGLPHPPRVYLGIDGPLSDELRRTVQIRSRGIYRRIDHPENTGLALNLNRLIDVLEDEEFVFRADADDLSEPTRFASQITFLKENPSIGIVGTALVEMDEECRFLRIRRWASEPDQIYRDLYKVSALAHPTVCFRRSALRRLGGYREGCGNSEDLDLWLRAAKAGIAMANLPDPLCRLRVTKDTYRRRSRAKSCWPEFRLYWWGCRDLYGWSWRHAFPILRLVSRLLPVPVVRLIYSGPWRQLVTGGARSERKPRPSDTTRGAA